jgi:hypothetical protein
MYCVVRVVAVALAFLTLVDAAAPFDSTTWHKNGKGA